MTTNADAENELVICPECGRYQADMGSHVCCEECGYGPMPYHDAKGNLIGA